MGNFVVKTVSKEGSIFKTDENEVNPSPQVFFLSLFSSTMYIYIIHINIAPIGRLNLLFHSFYII